MSTRRLASLATLAIMFGCASAPETIKVEGITDVSVPKFTLVDARPMENIRGGASRNSYSVWWVYGDDKISPPPMTVLRSGLARQLGASLDGKVIKVEKLEVSLTRLQKNAGDSAGAMYAPSSGSIGADILGGILAGVLINAFESSKSGPTIATEIVIDIEGKKIEYSERDFQASGDVDKVLAENLVKAVKGVASKISEIMSKKVDEVAGREVVAP